MSFVKYDTYVPLKAIYMYTRRLFLSFVKYDTFEIINKTLHSYKSSRNDGEIYSKVLNGVGCKTQSLYTYVCTYYVAVIPLSFLQISYVHTVFLLN